MTRNSDQRQRDFLAGVFTLGCGLVVVMFALSLIVGALVLLNQGDIPTPKFGLAEDSHEFTDGAYSEFPPELQISGAVREDNAKRNVRLWEPLLRLNPNWRNIPQPIGDCVSRGVGHAIQIRCAMQDHNCQPFPPHVYGLSRVTIGRGKPGCGQDGAVLSWAIQGVRDYGYLEYAAAQEPYTGPVAKSWGCRGPPAYALAASEPNRVTAQPVRNADELRDAICNGFPCVYAGRFGTRGAPRIADGRRVAEWNDTWAHCMAFVGYDGSGDTAYFYLLNSWGPSYHGDPMQNEIPGGVWVTFSTASKMVPSGEVWAVSDVKGFKVPSGIDWSAFGDE